MTPNELLKQIEERDSEFITNEHADLLVDLVKRLITAADKITSCCLVCRVCASCEMKKALESE